MPSDNYRINFEFTVWGRISEVRILPTDAEPDVRVDGASLNYGATVVQASTSLRTAAESVLTFLDGAPTLRGMTALRLSDMRSVLATFVAEVPDAAAQRDTHAAMLSVFPDYSGTPEICTITCYSDAEFLHYADHVELRIGTCPPIQAKDVQQCLIEAMKLRQAEVVEWEKRSEEALRDIAEESQSQALNGVKWHAGLDDYSDALQRAFNTAQERLSAAKTGLGRVVKLWRRSVPTTKG